MAFNHLVFDGIGANVILKHLAQCCCNSSSEERDATAYEEIRYRKLILDMEPIHRRDSGVHASVASSLCLACLSPQVRSDMAKVLPQQLSDECFIFSPDSINRLKDACSYLWPLLQGSCPSPSDTPTPPILSENDVVTALLWGSIAKARGSNNNREQQAKYQAKSVCAMAVNLRRFFEPCLPPTYMGNAITTVRYLVDSNTFRHQETGHSQLGKDTESLFGIRLDSILPIAKIAYGIRSRRCAFNGLYAQNLIAFIRSNGISDAIRNGPADIYVTSWRRLEIYELDFGSHLGHIDGFHTQASGVDGMCLIMPARASQSAGSTARQNNQQIPWDVRITLNTETMELFRNDDLMCWVLEGGECSLPGKDKLELR
ncbi:transferase [Aspergillus foveolatus]|uniref:transferase n=1 Tax=Aspergillus foveolatus TaxID=210207 RepID=UPI003CCE4685